LQISFGFTPSSKAVRDPHDIPSTIARTDAVATKA
jgi:hypothetical protein